MLKSPKLFFLLLFIFSFGVILRSFRLFTPLTELHDFRQTQTASIVWLYHKFGFNLFEYHLPMFGGKYLILEVPFYQAIVFLVTKFLGLHDYVGRLVSIGSFIVASLSIYYISYRILAKKKLALLTIFLYTTLPLNIFFYRTYMIDPFTLSLVLTAFAVIIHCFKAINAKYITLIFFLIFISVLSKMTVFFPSLFPMGYLLYKSFSKKEAKKRKKYIFLTIIYLLTIFSIFLLWHRYAIALNQSSFTLVPWKIKTWYLGTRYFQIDYYHLILKRIIYEISPLGIILIIFGLVSLWKAKFNLFAKILLLWDVNIIVYLILFNNLNYIHNYYQLPIYPPLILTLVYGMNHSLPLLKNKLVISLFFLYMLMNNSFPKSYFFVKDNPYQDYISSITKVIQSCTNENEKIIYIWPNADPNHPTVLYYAKRLGYNSNLYKLDKIKEILQHDSEVKSLVFFPVKKEAKEKIIVNLEKTGLKTKEECYADKTLVLRII